MKIYKMSDDIPDNISEEDLKELKKGNRSKKGGYNKSDFLTNTKDGIEKKLKITDIRQAVRNENRINVFVNGKYSFSLDIAQVVDLGVKIGREISSDELKEFKKASEFGKAYQRALEWALMRPRSKRELRDYLKRRKMKREAENKKREWEMERGIAEMIAKGEEVDARKLEKKRIKANSSAKEEKGMYDFDEMIVARLVERGYVDDLRFARYYAENRFVKKGISQKRLKMELLKKGVSTEIIEQVLDSRDDEEEILKIIEKKWGKYTEKKLISYLVRQGFSYQQVQNLVQNYEKD